MSSSNGTWKPLAFFSRKLDKAQKSYSTFDWELLAMYSAIKHFAYFLEGRKFHIYTDHLHWPVALNAGHRDSNGTSLSSLRHVRGRDNAVADALSHVDISIDPVARMTDPPSLDLLKMAQAQAADAGVQAYRTAITQLVLADLTIPGTTTTLLCDTSTGPLFLPHGTG